MKDNNLFVDILGSVVKSIVVSAAAGIITGILFAPDKGSKTRKEISKRGKEFTDLARDEFEEFMDYTRKKYEDARKQADDLIEQGEVAANELKEKINN